MTHIHIGSFRDQIADDFALTVIGGVVQQRASIYVLIHWELLKRVIDGMCRGVRIK
jgi:hypothetical protein